MPELIAVTMSVGTILNRDVNFLNFQYSQFVQKLGYQPFLIPNDLDYRPTMDQLPVKALLITGGHDIGCNYSSLKPELRGTITPLRDEQESRLFEWAVSHHIPVIGICRGMQLINVLLGGDLTTDLPAERPDGLNLHQRTTHQLKCIDRNDETIINSYHHQGLTAEQLAFELEPIAISPVDGIIEAVKHKTLPILAVQWHPERDEGAFEWLRNQLKEQLSI